MRGKRLVLVGILIGALVASAGFASLQSLFPSSGNVRNDTVGLHGYVVINAYHANGVLFATWQGHNSLTLNAVNQLSQCLSGADLPPYWGSCSGIVHTVWVDDGSNTEFRGTATNSLVPGGCNPNANPGNCTGWQAKGIVNCTSAVTLTRAGTEDSKVEAFDIVAISPISVSPGDVLTVTVTFTIS